LAADGFENGIHPSDFGCRRYWRSDDATAAATFTPFTRIVRVPRASFWGGDGGSLIILDQDAQLTFAYMMDKMPGSLSADDPDTTIALTAVLVAMS
jgi:CubicO group peptidase (beta-lactamase class C family)